MSGFNSMRAHFQQFMFLMWQYWAVKISNRCLSIVNGVECDWWRYCITIARLSTWPQAERVLHCSGLEYVCVYIYHFTQKCVNSGTICSSLVRPYSHPKIKSTLEIVGQSQEWLHKVLSSVMWSRIAWYIVANVTGENAVFIFRLEKTAGSSEMLARIHYVTRRRSSDDA
jgi:hypothetical protein